ncbi:MAG: Zn-dependent hydrolase [Rhodospirillaceae bacterium]|nr:Zn-dependent hydrolase [Rhodospirillaceae bacterium]|tara:strand:+ start:2945 stop:4192 length:1248 start_codon:yes stop_codon:yes gene_type:complete
MSQGLQINADRLWDTIMEMAKIDATEKGGNCRLALSDGDKQGRDLFVSWCEAAGMTCTVDKMGNIFARRPGRDAGAKPVSTGSHLDTQPTGGKFDGVYGVLAGLEIVRCLNDAGIETEAPMEVICWTNEEGARFAPAMIGSGVFSGDFSLEYAHNQSDSDGKTMGEELARIGYLGDEEPGGHDLGFHFEAHIEQGPILEAEKKPVGVVTGVQGIRWYDVRIKGMEAHAGPTPMEMRKDAMVAAAKLIQHLDDNALGEGPHGRTTVKVEHCNPTGSRNTIAGDVQLSVDIRHPDQEAFDRLDAGLRWAATKIGIKKKVEIEVDEIWVSPPVVFDENCVGAVRKGAELLGYDHMDMVSGAGHDAVYVSRVAPTGMIFVPCEGGISHNEIENAAKDDLEAGCNVLLHAMLDRARAVPE